MGSRNLIFGLGNNSCGEASCYGMSIATQGEAGGVIPLDEVVRLRNFLNKHLEMALLTNKKAYKKRDHSTRKIPQRWSF